MCSDKRDEFVRHLENIIIFDETVDAIQKQSQGSAKTSRAYYSTKYNSLSEAMRETRFILLISTISTFFYANNDDLFSTFLQEKIPTFILSLLPNPLN